MIIYKQYNQQQLNDQYNNRLHVPDFAFYLESWGKRSAEIRQTRALQQDIPYGNHPREVLDIFPSGKPNSKVLVFIHGGYWHRFDKTRFHFVASSFLEQNITTVLLNYPLAPAATMDEMVASSRKAIVWLQQNLAGFNADPQQVYVAGHSAGGHLATMLLEKEWAQTIQFRIKGVCALSGLFDLRPIQLSYLNDVLQMDREMAIRNSPVEVLPVQDCPVLIASGTAETNEFKEQSSHLYNQWKTKGVPAEWIELPGANHFSILDSLADGPGLLHQAVTRLMGV